MTQRSADTIKQAVKEQYGKLARRADAGASESCCGINPSQDVYEASQIYIKAELEALPDTVTAASAGCGNPTAISELIPGETVLDLGSGGGIDCFLAREKVGPKGRVIGLDMTADMINLARKNAEKL
ncbi:MAG: methyltransferase domain-containing protein, partial [Dehalococcoidia bacterium]